VTSGARVDPPVCHACDRIDIDFVLASGLVVSDYGFDRAVEVRAASEPTPDTAWMLTPGVSTHLKGNTLTLSFDRFPDEVSEENSRISVTRTRRTIHVDFDETLLTFLVERLRSGLTLERMNIDVPAHSRAVMHDIVACLIGWDAVVETSEIRSRLAHEWSMRGGRGRARMSASEVEALTFSSRVHDDGHAAHVPLSPPRTFPCDSLSRVLRQRRSPTRYDASPISLDQLGQLLGAACGVTGELTMTDRRRSLRAYPSPGALYAVDAYVMPTRVDGLAGGVFRYDPERHALATVHSRQIDPASFCLPDTRSVVHGIAVFIALTMFLPRATRKYGDVSYRILVAEAGCIAENLILVAHALGLRAGPFTGVFDILVDRAIGLNDSEDRFVVGVLIGREENPS